MKHNLLGHLEKNSLTLVRHIGVLAHSMGMKAYLVGGLVRDLQLKKVNLDLDITVEGNGMRLAQALAASEKGRLQKYPAFGTATVTLPHGRVVDFATARTEMYARPGAFPSVKPSNIHHDLFRRDFTINAMAIAIGPEDWGQVIDPFGGRKDLKTRKIRILHAHSFIDDPTRIWRAARFAARFKFALEAKTLKALKAAVKAGAMDTVKPQRYLKEYNKIVNENSRMSALGLLKTWWASKGEQYAATH